MRRVLKYALIGALLFTGAVLFLKWGEYEPTPGGPRGVETPTADAPPPAPQRVGPHGGPVASLDSDFTGELVLDADGGVLTLYLLGAEGTAPAPIIPDAAPLADVTVVAPLAAGSFRLELGALPDAGDFEGTSSRYQAKSKGLEGVTAFRADVRVFMGEMELKASFPRVSTRDKPPPPRTRK